MSRSKRSIARPAVPRGRLVRVRSLPLAQIDEAKLALALAMMAKRLRQAAQEAVADPTSDEVPDEAAGESEVAA
jgi:hypothetical protein